MSVIDMFSKGLFWKEKIPLWTALIFIILLLFYQCWLLKMGLFLISKDKILPDQCLYSSIVFWSYCKNKLQVTVWWWLVTFIIHWAQQTSTAANMKNSKRSSQNISRHKNRIRRRQRSKWKMYRNLLLLFCHFCWAPVYSAAGEFVLLQMKPRAEQSEPQIK